jgi:hypothetical protein
MYGNIQTSVHLQKEKKIILLNKILPFSLVATWPPNSAFSGQRSVSRLQKGENEGRREVE